MHFRWRGKQRAEPDSARRQFPRDDSNDGTDLGSGGDGGILLPLQYIGTEGSDASYSLEIQVGDSAQSVSLQVDTGSSDLWIASTSCSSAPCNNVPSDKRYSPSPNTVQTGSAFGIKYLRGSVNGTIMFDTVSIGGYSVGGQALASVDVVDSESLSSSFSGIIGLALPDNSLISHIITPTADSFDGAHVISNLFSLDPIEDAPAARFISMTLSRPGSKAVPAQLGIGRHPSKEQVPQIDASKVHYTIPLSSMTSTGMIAGQLFWRSSVRDITVWVNGEPKAISLIPSGSGGGGGNFPTAVLDTGIPVILATKPIADAIYGAIGIGPASDGNYYVDCSTPLNLTITLDDRDPFPVHPLDLTLVPPSDASSKTCIGLIQAGSNPYADIILGVPFLRSVYMVMAYQVPNTDGSFPDLRETEESDSFSGSVEVNRVRPRLGLQSLVDANTAMDEFHRVRVLNQPLDQTPSHASEEKSGHLSVGVAVLIGLIGFFALCFGLFGLRFFLMRRKYNRGNEEVGNHDKSVTAGDVSGSDGALLGWWKRRRQPNYSGDEKSRGEYELTGTGMAGQLQTEEDLRKSRFNAYVNRERLASQYSSSSAHTHVEYPGEFGVKKSASPTPSNGDDNGHQPNTTNYDEPWNPATALNWGDNHATLVGTGRRDHRKKVSDSSSEGRSSSPNEERVPMLQDHQINPTTPTFAHTRERSVDLPPLPHETNDDSTPNDMEEFGAISMAGIGTAARGSLIDADIQFSRSHHVSGSMSSTNSTLLNARRPARTPSGPRQSSTYSNSSLSNSYMGPRRPSS